MSQPQHVAVTSGDGVVARRQTAVLFVSSETQHQADVLVNHFVQAATDVRAMAAVLDALTQTPPGLPEADVAILRWTPEAAHLLVRGDVRVTTDDPTLPFMNGAGLAGWIERTLFSLPVTVTAGSGAEADASVMGESVAGGGFIATITAGQAASSSVDRAPTPGSVIPRPTSSFGGGPDLEPQSLIPPPPPPAEPAYSALWDDPKTARVPAASNGAASPRLRSTFSHQPVRATEESNGPLMGRECMNAHPNPPEAASCRECGATLNPTAGALLEFAPGAIGTLVMNDGRSIPLERSALVGRKPNADERDRWSNFTLVVSDDTKVSRNHVEVLVSGWDVQVVDCGSRNGTTVQFRGSTEREALTPGVPVFITVGSNVRFGGQSFTLLGPGEQG